MQREKTAQFLSSKKSFAFQVPRFSASSEVAFVSIRIKGPTQDFRKRNTVLVKNTQSLVFVQTDKPVYKPEQTGK